MHISFWAIPAEPVYLQLKTVIEEIAEAYQLALFAPHITIGSLDVEEQSQLQPLLASLRRPMFELRFGDVQSGESYYHCLYLTVVDNPVLTEMRLQLLSRISAEPGPTDSDRDGQSDGVGDTEANLKNQQTIPAIYQPHISLAYADVVIDEFPSIALQGQSVMIDQLLAVRTDGPPQAWQTLARIPLPASYTKE